MMPFTSFRATLIWAALLGAAIGVLAWTSAHGSIPRDDRYAAPLSAKATPALPRVFLRYPAFRATKPVLRPGMTQRGVILK